MSTRPNILRVVPDALRPEVLLPEHPCIAPNMQRVRNVSTPSDSPRIRVVG